MRDFDAVSIPTQIALDMRALPEETRRFVRPRLREAGRMVVVDAVANASWSTRIPGSIRMTTSFRVDREGITITAGNKTTPHARPFEDIRQRGSFRHPVHADQNRFTRKGWTWVSQPARPFLFPAALANEAAATATIRTALDEAGRSLGFDGS